MRTFTYIIDICVTSDEFIEPCSVVLEGFHYFSLNCNEKCMFKANVLGNVLESYSATILAHVASEKM